MKDFSKFSAIIIGAGDATGAALTKKFASHGYKVCPARRPRSIEKVNKLADEINNSGGWAKGYGVDARDEDEIAKFFREVEEEVAISACYKYNYRYVIIKPDDFVIPPINYDNIQTDKMA